MLPFRSFFMSQPIFVRPMFSTRISNLWLFNSSKSLIVAWVRCSLTVTWTELLSSKLASYVWISIESKITCQRTTHFSNCTVKFQYLKKPVFHHIPQMSSEILHWTSCFLFSYFHLKLRCSIFAYVWYKLHNFTYSSPLLKVSHRIWAESLKIVHDSLWIWSKRLKILA